MSTLLLQCVVYHRQKVLFKLTYFVTLLQSFSLTKVLKIYNRTKNCISKFNIQIPYAKSRTMSREVSTQVFIRHIWNICRLARACNLLHRYVIVHILDKPLP